jgi:hypothetical protein
MSFDLKSIREATAAHINAQPHPLAPDLTVGEYPIYERVASMLNDQVLRGNTPHPEMVVHAQKTLQAAKLSAGEFEHIWTMARPVANRLLDRDPSIVEMAEHLRTATPRDVHQYYSDHPYPGYEEVRAGDVAKYMRAAEPIARRYGRTPNEEEVTRFAVAGYSHDDMHQHYGGDW